MNLGEDTNVEEEKLKRKDKKRKGQEINIK